ncbi:hypothetical protein [Sinimarinibacterium flocculans]|uniref:hypothetical protein n=1 Tax=Sinimarinibacterium flocculans TaxID=985250 RepID=UPI003512A1BC
MKITAAVLILSFASFANAGFLNQLERGIIDNAAREVSQSADGIEEFSKDATKATNICQLKCAICFDGIACDFDCVRESCPVGPGSGKGGAYE